jgi:hypothetical protein
MMESTLRHYELALTWNGADMGSHWYESLDELLEDLEVTLYFSISGSPKFLMDAP